MEPTIVDESAPEQIPEDSVSNDFLQALEGFRAADVGNDNEADGSNAPEGADPRRFEDEGGALNDPLLEPQASDVVVAAAAAPADPGPVPAQPAKLCCKCDETPAPDEHTEGTFTCSMCNNKRSTMSQAFGCWPIDLFNMLPPDQQTAFWRTKTKGRAAIEQVLVLLVSKQRIQEEMKKDTGEYLPISVWVKRGFDGGQILATCTDIQ